MLEKIILGIAQGLTEWIPISSEGIIILIKTHYFPAGESLEMMVRQALQLHFGTFLAALVYFRQDVGKLTKALFRFKGQPKETQKLFVFLCISTIISGIIGLLLLKLFSAFTSQSNMQERVITLAVGFFLLGTAFLELRAKKGGYRSIEDIKLSDSLLLGVVQGLACLPGLSRSGLTVSVLLLRKFDKTYALKLSFLMSLPIVLAGNIFLNCSTFDWPLEAFVGIFSAFLFGLATIHLLLKIAENINFGYFVLLFGLLTILSAII